MLFAIQSSFLRLSMRNFFFFSSKFLIIAQDSTKIVGGIDHISGGVSVTNNGISLLPTFSLGKPATIIDFSIGGKKISFEPQLRFSLEGKPWSFIFWWRYKFIQNSRFRLSAGAHPSFAFREEKVQMANGNTENKFTSNQYIATEISPNYVINKNITLGVYYLYSHGFDVGTTNNTHFFTLNSVISNVKITKHVRLRLFPQIYYLQMDNRNGYYLTSIFTFTHNKSPFGISSVVNKSIQSSLTGTKDFNWNISLLYLFNKKIHQDI